MVSPDCTAPSLQSLAFAQHFQKIYCLYQEYENKKRATKRKFLETSLKEALKDKKFSQFMHDRNYWLDLGDEKKNESERTNRHYSCYELLRGTTSEEKSKQKLARNIWKTVIRQHASQQATFLSDQQLEPSIKDSDLLENLIKKYNQNCQTLANYLSEEAMLPYRTKDGKCITISLQQIKDNINQGYHPLGIKVAQQ